MCTTDIMETTENEVNIRIPLEEASINVKVKDREGGDIGLFITLVPKVLL